MSRSLDKLTENVTPERITPQRAIQLLIHGLLPPEDAATFKPGNLKIEAIIRLLHRANEVRNRSISINHVHRLARDMTNKKWLQTGDTIKLDSDGFVRDGQHRLLALIHSGTSHDFLVVRNMDPRAQLVTDVGRPRNVATQVTMAGHGNSPHISAIANMTLRYRAQRMLNTFQSSVMEVLEFVETEPEVHDALAATWRVRRTVSRAPQAALGTLYIEGGHIDPVARDKFFNLLATGAGLESGNPILVLRNKLGVQVVDLVRYKRAGVLWQLVYTWNKWRQHKEIQLIVVPKALTSRTFPTML
jgi:hypothetical protein